MPVAFVLIKASTKELKTLINNLLFIDEVSEAYSIAGLWDIIIKIDTERFENLAKVITEKIIKIEGIEETLTLMAFQSGVAKSKRVDACDEAAELEKQNRISDLYRLCRTCYNLKYCEFGSRVIVFGP